MTTREKTMMKLVIDAIEKNGPMTVRGIMDMLGMSDKAVSKHCYNAHNAGYLTMKPDEATRPSTGGRRSAVYTRTAKAFEVAAPTAMALKKRAQKRRELENRKRKELRAEVARERSKRSAPFIPFRSQFDELFYGEARFSGDFSTVKPRVIERWTEKEAACSA
jgi:hypothetical protein